MSCCLYRVVLEERPSVRVLASAVDDCPSCVLLNLYKASCISNSVSSILQYKNGWNILSLFQCSEL